MPFAVHVDKRVLRGYIRRALKAYPKEYMETLWGRIRGSDVEIVSFQNIEHTATKDAAYYDPGELASQNEEAQESQLQVLGTIHSHPDGCTWPSEDDMKSALMGGEIVCGIVAIKNGARRSAKVIMLPVIKPFELIQH
jgi:proteasome lid subunit RPN8/RPN11